MKVSIITINYNNFDGLKKTVESVLCQTYHEFEYIIVDGASTDGGAEYVKEIGKKEYPFVLKWVSEKDTGIYNAMNKGIRMSTGDYLLFLNSGDTLVNEQVLADVFADKTYQSDLLLGRCYVSKNGERIWLSNPSADVTLATLYYRGIMHQATFIRRTCMIEYGCYDESFRWLADIDFWFRSLIYGKATVEVVDVKVADFDNSGESSIPKNEQAFIDEADRIFKNEKLHRIYPDYYRFRNQIEVVNEYEWINQHRILRQMLKFYHKLLKRINRHR